MALAKFTNTFKALPRIVAIIAISHVLVCCTGETAKWIGADEPGDSDIESTLDGDEEISDNQENESADQPSADEDQTENVDGDEDPDVIEDELEEATEYESEELSDSDENSTDGDSDTEPELEAEEDLIDISEFDIEEISEDSEEEITEEVEAEIDIELEEEVEEEIDAQLPLFDMDLILDASTLDCQVLNTYEDNSEWPTINIRDIRYTSYEVIQGTLHPIRIQASVALPGGTNLPGIVAAHGLDGEADESMAVDLARYQNMAMLVYSGPGQGLSEGRGTTDDYTPLWDTVPDPRGSWFWGHSVAAMRGLGCLGQMDEVSPDKLGMYGTSAGGMATLMASSVDDRIKAAVAVSATGDLAASADAGAWVIYLLAVSGLGLNSDHFNAFNEILDPIVLVPDTECPVLLINGAQDEFFPLNSHVNTMNALTGDHHRTTVIPNWDHGWFTKDCEPFGPCEANFDNSQAATEKTFWSQRMWFRHHLAGDDVYASLPPQFELQFDQSPTFITATMQTGGDYTVESVTIWASLDQAYTFTDFGMNRGVNGQWMAALTTQYNPAGTVLFAEIEFSVPDHPGEKFWLSTIPSLPRGFVPEIRPLP